MPVRTLDLTTTTIWQRTLDSLMCNEALARGGILLEGVAIGETPREAAAGDPSAYAEALLKVWDRALKLF